MFNTITTCLKGLPAALLCMVLLHILNRFADAISKLLKPIISFLLADKKSFYLQRLAEKKKKTRVCLSHLISNCQTQQSCSKRSQVYTSVSEHKHSECQQVEFWVQYVQAQETTAARGVLQSSGGSLTQAQSHPTPASSDPGTPGSSPRGSSSNMHTSICRSAAPSFTADASANISAALFQLLLS